MTALSNGENFVNGVGNNDFIIFHGLQLKGHSSSDTSGYAIDVSPATSSDWITIEHCIAWNIWTGFHINTIGKATLIDDAIGGAVNGYIFEGSGNNASQALGISAYNCTGIGLWFKSGAFSWTINAGDFVGNATNVKNDGGQGIIINTMNQESYTAYGIYQTSGDMTLNCVQQQGAATGVVGRIDGGTIELMHGNYLGWNVTSTSAKLNCRDNDTSGQLNNGDSTDTNSLTLFNKQYVNPIALGTMRPASGAGGYTFALGNRGRIFDFVGDGTNADYLGRVIKQASSVSSAISAISKSGSTCTVTVGSTTGMTTGNTVTISGTASGTNDGEFFITVSDGTHFTYTNANGVTNASETGTAYLDSFGLDIYSTQKLLSGVNTWAAANTFSSTVTNNGNVANTALTTMTASSGSSSPLTVRQNGSFHAFSILDSSGSEVAFSSNAGIWAGVRFLATAAGGNNGNGAFYNTHFDIYDTGSGLGVGHSSADWLLASASGVLTKVATTVGSSGVAMTNIRHGISGAMIAGAVTVTDAGCTANTRYFFTAHTLGTITIPGGYYASTRTPGTSFVITSSQITDTSTIDWLAIEP